ncbi:hypothetical protein OIU84_023659, partial [Salix udensis]
MLYVPISELLWDWESSETPDLAEQLVGSKIKSPMLAGLDNFLYYDLLDGLILHVLCSYWRLKLYISKYKDIDHEVSMRDSLVCRFYEGVVDSYDPIKKKHRVLYGDGDEEKLNLKRQRWELIKDDIFAVQVGLLPHPVHIFLFLSRRLMFQKSATSSGVLQKAKSETKSNSLKRSKAVSSLKRAENISKTRARRSAYGAVPNEPTVVEKPADHNTSGPDSGSEDDGKNTPGPDGGSEDDGKSTSGPGSGSKDDGENSTVKLNIQDPLTDINSKQAVLETVNPSDNGGPKAGTEYCSFNSEQTTSVGVTLSKDESSKGDDECQGSDGSNREQQGE